MSSDARTRISAGESADVRELEVRLEEARRHIADLEALVSAGDLLDPSLDQPRLALLALRLCLRLLPADVALLVTHAGPDACAHYLCRGEDSARTLAENPSRLARDVLETGREATRRGGDSPGAVAVAEILGTAPALRLGVPLRRADRTLGALEVAYREDPGPRLEVDFRVLRTVADHVAMALDHCRLLRDRERRVREMSHLYDIGTKISAHLDLGSLLDAILDSFLELVPADAAGIFLIHRGTREIRDQTIRGYAPDRMGRLRLKIGKGILGWVADQGEGIIVPDVRLDSRYVEARASTRSEMAAPLKYEDRVIGVFNLESDRRNAYGPHDLDLLLTFSTQAAISISNARLHAEAVAKRRLEEQLGIARDLQASLLPREDPRIPGHTLIGKNVPSSAVGGDYFDFLPLSGGRWAIVVADVSGNGIPAALIMAGFRAEIRAALRHSDDPREVLAGVNQVLCGELEPERFVTALVGVYSPDSGTLVYSNGGHEPGLLIRSGGEIERLTEGGLLLGAFPDADYRKAMVHLERGDRLLLYTDGLSESGDPWGGPLEEEGILRLFRAADPERDSECSLAASILERAEAEVACPPDEVDDRTLVVLSRLDDDTPSPGPAATSSP